MMRLLDEHRIEDEDWPDRGCSVAPRCLECPLVRCRYDVPGGLAALLREPRNREVVEWRQRGEEVPVIAAHFHLSRRQVFRLVRP